MKVVANYEQVGQDDVELKDTKTKQEMIYDPHRLYLMLIIPMKNTEICVHQGYGLTIYKNICCKNLEKQNCYGTRNVYSLIGRMGYLLM